MAQAAQVLWRAAGRALGLIAGWGLAVTLLLATAQTLAPGDLEVWIGLVRGAAVAVIALGALYLFVAEWVRNVPKERYHLRAENEALEALTRDFRIRGRLCRAAAGGLFLGTTTIALGGLYVFSMAAWSRSEYHESLPLQLPSLVEPLSGNADPGLLLTDPNAVALLQDLLDHGSRPAWNESIGPLLLLFFVLRVTGALYRYMVRLASFYESRADYLQFGGPTEGLSMEEVLRFLDTGVTNSNAWWRNLLEAMRRRQRRQEGESRDASGRTNGAE